jgi:hypothetical protein
MPDPPTPPEAQSAPANSQVSRTPSQARNRSIELTVPRPPQIWEQLSGAKGKLNHAAMQQEEKARLEEEEKMLRMEIRQTRADAIDFSERARHARSKLEYEEEKLDDLKDRVAKARTTVAAWPTDPTTGRGDRSLVQDPEVSEPAAQLDMEKQWLKVAQQELNKTIGQRDSELRSAPHAPSSG